MMKWLHIVTFTLVLVGGLNWGLIGFFDYNLVESLGLSSMLVTWTYKLVGLSVVYILLTHKKDCMICSKMMK